MGNKLQHGHADTDDGGTLSASVIPPLAAQGRVVRTAGDVSTTSTSFVDLTDASITLTTTARPVLIGLTGSCQNSIQGQNVMFDLDIDGTRQGGTNGLANLQADAANAQMTIGLTYLTASLSAGSHTFKIQWRISSGTGTIQASSTQPYVFWVTEIR